MTQGYSGTPLGRKLGLKPAMRVAWLGMPDDIRTLLSDEVPGLHHVNPADTPDMIHVFTSRRMELEAVLTAARTQMAQNGMVWASWPKKSSKVARRHPRCVSAHGSGRCQGLCGGCHLVRTETGHSQGIACLTD